MVVRCALGNEAHQHRHSVDLGSAEAGGTVTLYDNVGAIGTVITASGVGTWVFTTPSLGRGTTP